MMSMSAQVFFVQAAARDVLVVPAGAVSIKRPEGGGKPKAEVTVVTASGKQEVREVETGIRNRVSVEVKSGLAEGDKVVVSAGGGNASGGDRNSRRGMRMPPMF